MTTYPWERERRSAIETALDFLISDHRCRKRGRFISSGGVDVFYWNATTGVLAYVENREEFTVRLCPLPAAGAFPPRIDEYHALRRIEWFDAFDVAYLVTGRRPRFSYEQLYGTDPAVLAAYADALRGPCRTLLSGDAELWDRLRRQRRARIAYNRRRYVDEAW